MRSAKRGKPLLADAFLEVYDVDAMGRCVAKARRSLKDRGHNMQR